MAKLLETRLPLALTEVDANTFNRLVRILEINLGKFDPNSTPQFNDAQISTFAFNAGDVIWNTSIGVLQVYTYMITKVGSGTMSTSACIVGMTLKS